MAIFNSKLLVYQRVEMRDAMRCFRQVAAEAVPGHRLVITEVRDVLRWIGLGPFLSVVLGFQNLPG